jgi:hypothetical protein
MDIQSLINFAMATAIAVAGWFARTLWDAIKQLQVDLHNVEVHLPNTYVKQAEINARFDKLENMLERVFDKLDQKQDKTL